MSNFEVKIDPEQIVTGIHLAANLVRGTWQYQARRRGGGQTQQREPHAKPTVDITAEPMYGAQAPGASRRAKRGPGTRVDKVEARLDQLEQRIDCIIKLLREMK